MKRVFLGLVRPLNDSRQIDQSEGRLDPRIVANRVVFLMIFAHFLPERKLRTNGVASSDITSSAGLASFALRRCEEGRSQRRL